MMQIKIVTPDATALSVLAYMVVMPAEKGEMGVLQGHSNMVVALKPGIVSIYVNDKEISHEFQISEGFAEVSSDALTILVESATQL